MNARSIAGCADLALVKGVRQINTNGCPTLAQEAFSLEVCGTGSAASTCLAGFGFERLGPRGGPIFGSVLATSLFPNLYSLAVLFLGPPSGLCFGAALRPALCVLAAGRSLHERSVFGLHFLGLQGAALRLRARQPVGNAPLSAVRGSLAPLLLMP